ncbi:hypothetical protein ABZ570_29725 [Micromonospora sp. NPDC007271]|uniref:hypothetical protein n=1 Tax=Micromonospora sp. NPDC007271 TaxID=3154587 RepID=UPI0033C64074
MNPPRPALRVALLALAASALAFAVIAVALGWPAYQYVSARDRATAVVAGTVIEDGIGDYGDIRVRWVDHAGRAHVQRFAIYDTDRYRKDQRFPVAYDPAASVPRGFPADPDETSAEDDLMVPIAVAGIVAVLIAFGWALRGVLFGQAVKRPGSSMVASVLAGLRPDGPPISLGDSIWISLAADRHGRPVRWQRVVWHPAVDSVNAPVPVTVHGDVTSKRRVVVELPGQVRLVPIGRLRHRPPKRLVLEERADVRADLDDFLIIPAGTPPPSGRRWWQRAVAFAVAGAALGALCAVLFFSGGLAILVAAVAGSALLVNVWALGGAEP